MYKTKINRNRDTEQVCDHCLSVIDLLVVVEKFGNLESVLVAVAAGCRQAHL